jgi:hypothetical protein
MDRATDLSLLKDFENFWILSMIIIFPQSIQSRVIIVVLALVEFPIICFGNKTQFFWLAGVLHLYLMLTLFICTWFLKNRVWNFFQKIKLGKFDFCSISSLIFTIHNSLQRTFNIKLIPGPWIQKPSLDLIKK